MKFADKVRAIFFKGSATPTIQFKGAAFTTFKDVVIEHLSEYIKSAEIASENKVILFGAADPVCTIHFTDPDEMATLLRAFKERRQCLTPN